MSNFMLSANQSGEGLILLKGGSEIMRLNVHIAEAGSSRNMKLLAAMESDGCVLSDSNGRQKAKASISSREAKPILLIEMLGKGHTGDCLDVRGRIKLRGCIPCFIEGKKSVSPYFHMTTGSPDSSLFDSLYSANDDTAVRFDCETVTLEPGDRSSQFRLGGQKAAIVLSEEHYKTNINGFYKPIDRKRFSRPPVGWLSWYCYFGDFDEEDTLKTLDFAAENFKDYGFEYVQLETWQQNSWKLPVINFIHSLECDAVKFPHGMKWVADRIHEKGLKAGLWIVPLGTGADDYYQEHKEMFLHDAAGDPISTWSGKYTLDPTHPKARKRIFDMMHTVTHIWGYDYTKIDGLEYNYADPRGDYMSGMYPRIPRESFYRPVEDPLREIAVLLRKAIGPDAFFNVCQGSVYHIGKFTDVGDAIRVGTDVFWEGHDPQWGSILAMIKVLQQNHYVHNIVCFSDPDVLSIRPPLLEKQAELLCTAYAISGQLLFLGDILYELPANRVKMLQRLMPVVNVFPGHIPAADPADDRKSSMRQISDAGHTWINTTDAEAGSEGLPWSPNDLRAVWVLHIRHGCEQYQLAALFNWDEHDSKAIALDRSELGLPAEGDYLLYDFWRDEFLGRLGDGRQFELPCQSCMLLCVRKESAHPQVLSVNRHVTQDAVSLSDVCWDEHAGKLTGTSEVVGGDEYVVTIHVPSGYRVSSASCDCGKVSCRSTGDGLAKLSIQLPENSVASWSVLFSK
jgi:hypothetical protein